MLNLLLNGFEITFISQLCFLATKFQIKIAKIAHFLFVLILLWIFGKHFVHKLSKGASKCLKIFKSFQIKVKIILNGFSLKKYCKLRLVAQLIFLFFCLVIKAPLII
jgi:hypothetical protein